ncbi:hypothetical protein RvY_06236 [Ramazzottius varieornatus]|uniref:Endonuclease/exonuclease/phosphatase domain-containing protein n=1 Tax=Ramazzottius varieornatus TaxID=947166 RepID=A0A1D1V1D7_RAMVA|nr:hypothetical protein RvY_06236 [Ramazzottius varieornatus]
MKLACWNVNGHKLASDTATQALFKTSDIVVPTEIHLFDCRSFFDYEHFPVLSAITHNATVGSWVERGGITIVSSKYKFRRFKPQFPDEFLAVEINRPEGASVCTILVVYFPPCQSQYISLE